MLAAVLARLLQGRDDGVVDRDHLGDVGVQAVGRAVPDLLGDGDEQVGADERRDPGVAERLERAERRGDAGLVVEVAALDEAARGDDRVGLERDEVADLDAEGVGLLGREDRLVEADLDQRPADALRVDLVAVVVPAGLERQHGAGVGGAGAAAGGSSVKTTTWAPSAKRALWVPSWVTCSRPFSFTRSTMQPIVSACTTTARSGRDCGGRHGRVEQRRAGSP